MKKCFVKTRVKIDINGHAIIIPVDEEMIDVECFCLCMKNLTHTDIQVGDKVWNGADEYGIVIENASEEKYLGIKYDILTTEVEEDFENIIKIIGPISSKAIWIKEGDEFDEDEVFIQKICYDDSSSPYDSYCSFCHRSASCDNDEGFKVLVKNETCKHFH